MGSFEPKIYSDIDWTVLRANAFAQMGRKTKGPQDWDEKARSFAGRNKSSAYVSRFLAHLPLNREMTVLDVGSGPGTLAIPIARKVHKVTAIDFSQGMLDTLDELARAENIANITSIRCAWEDDWAEKGIGPHDIAIASRSMGVKDLEPAMRKIHSFATRYVFLSDRIGATPFDKEAFAALGRRFTAGPDYIYTLNILYTLGIYPNVTVLDLEQDVTYCSMEEAVQAYSWMFHDLTAEELAALQNYIAGRIIDSSDSKITVRRDTPPRWALIWWPKDASACMA